MKITHRVRENLLGLGFTSPWIIGFAIFALFPIMYSLFLSFHQVNITANGIETIFIGFDNYITAFTKNLKMIEALVLFLQESLLMIVVINVFSVLFALLLASKIKGKGIFRTIFFLPVVIVSGPVMAELIDKNVIIMPNLESYQIIQIIASTFGETVSGLIVDSFQNLIYMFWFSGVQLIVYLTMIQRFDGSMYEAAEIDGASKWDSFWKITLPSLKPVIMLNLVYTLVSLATFDNNQVITVIKEALFDAQQGYGFASAISWIYFLALLIIIAFIILVFTFNRKKVYKKQRDQEYYKVNQLRYENETNIFVTNKTARKAKVLLAGRNSDGIIYKVGIYTLLIVMSFAFLYPFIYLVLTGLQSPEDVINPSVGLLPSTIYFGNFSQAIKVLNFGNSLLESIKYSVLPTICQVASCAVVGYGLARFNFKGNKVMLGLIAFTFIIPPQILMIPTFVMFSNFGFLDSILTLLIPASLGQGLRSAIFIFLFFQSFRMLPKEYDEAAEIDGASKLGIFFRIALPLSVPIMIVAFLFSLVWYWNETYLLSLYIPDASTLPLQLSKFAEAFRALIEQTGGNGDPLLDTINESYYMAGTLLSILPLLLVYFVMQKWFVEGVDKSGLTGQ